MSSSMSEIPKWWNGAYPTRAELIEFIRKNNAPLLRELSYDRLTHTQIIYLMKALKYYVLAAEDGFCHGVGGVAGAHMIMGRIHEFNKLLQDIKNLLDAGIKGEDASASPAIIEETRKLNDKVDFDLLSFLEQAALNQQAKSYLDYQVKKENPRPQDLMNTQKVPPFSIAQGDEEQAEEADIEIFCNVAGIYDFSSMETNRCLNFLGALAETIKEIKLKGGTVPSFFLTVNNGAHTIVIGYHPGYSLGLISSLNAGMKRDVIYIDPQTGDYRVFAKKEVLYGKVPNHIDLSELASKLDDSDLKKQILAHALESGHIYPHLPDAWYTYDINRQWRYTLCPVSDVSSNELEKGKIYVDVQNKKFHFIDVSGQDRRDSLPQELNFSNVEDPQLIEWLERSTVEGKLTQLNGMEIEEIAWDDFLTLHGFLKTGLLSNFQNLSAAHRSKGTANVALCMEFYCHSEAKGSAKKLQKVFDEKLVQKGLIEPTKEMVAARDVFGQSWLIMACSFSLEDINLVKSLLDKGADVRIQDHKGYTALHLAAQMGHVGVTAALINKGADANLPTKRGSTPLHLAAYMGHREVVLALMKNGANAELRNKQGNTALHTAVYRGHVEVVLALMKNGANAELRNKQDNTALHVAAEMGHAEMVQVLLEEGLEAKLTNAQGETALHVAARRGHAEVVRVILEKGLGAKLTNTQGETALHVAVQKGDAKMFRVLLEQGANANLLNKHGYTPLHVAAQVGHVGMVSQLTGRGANVNSLGKQGNAPLHLAAYMGHAEMVLALISNGADPNLRNKQGETPLRVAMQNGHVEMVRVLLGSGADADLTALLRVAMQKGDVEMVRVLLEHGADVDFVNDEGNSALHVAVQEGDVEMARVLLEHGADVDFVNEEDNTALHVAADGGDVEMVRMLLKQGADASLVNDEGNTALQVAEEADHIEVIRVLEEDYDAKQGITAGRHRDVIDILSEDEREKKEKEKSFQEAARKGEVETVKALLAQGVDVNVQDDVGFSALHWAAAKDHSDVVRILLDNKANANLPSHQYYTAMYIAARNGYDEIVDMLLKQGVDVNIPDQYGDTALHMAAQMGYAEVVSALVNNGADVNLRNKQGQTAKELAVQLKAIGVINAFSKKEKEEKKHLQMAESESSFTPAFFPSPVPPSERKETASPVRYKTQVNTP